LHLITLVFFDDILLPYIIVSTINKKLHFYSKSNYFSNYFIRKFLEWGGCIPVDTTKGKNHKETNKKAFESALDYLRNDEIVGIFPEGTRSYDGKLRQAKSGVAKLAIAAKVPILPIGIIDSYKILPKGKFLPRLVRCKINIGKPMHLDKYYNKKITKTLLRKITNDIMKEIAKLSNQEYNF